METFIIVMRILVVVGISINIGISLKQNNSHAFGGWALALIYYLFSILKH